MRICDKKSNADFVLRFIAHIFFCLLWVSLFWNSEAFLINTILMAMVSSSCFPYAVRNCRKKLPLIFSAVFSFMSFAGEYKLFLPIKKHVFLVLLALLSGFFVFNSIFSALTYFAGKKLNRNQTENVRKLKPELIFLLSFLVLSSVYTVVWYFLTYPGNLTPDSISSVRQALTGKYSNHHPLLFTFTVQLFIKIGKILFGTINESVAVYVFFQLIFLSVIFAFSVMTMYQAGVKTVWVTACVIFYAFTPYHYMFASTVWKDVLFGGGILLYISALYRILNRIGRMWLNYILLALGGVIFGLGRSNGLAAYFVFCIILYFIFKDIRAKPVLVNIVLVLFCFLCKRGLVSLLQIPQADVVEYLSIPLQQTARLIVEKVKMREEEADVINQLMDPAAVKTEYLAFSSDPVKKIVRTHGADYLNSHLETFFLTYAKLGFRYPGIYVRAWIDQTRGFWNSGYKYWRWQIVISENEMGLVQTGNPAEIQNIIISWNYNFSNSMIFSPVLSIGLNVWCLVFLFYYDFVRKSIKIILVIPVLLLVGTLLVTTPVAYEFRYAYSVFTSLPFLAGIHLFENESFIITNVNR